MQQFVATIVAAYLHKSAILPDDLPGLIASVGQAFGDLGKPTSAKSALPIPSEGQNSKDMVPTNERQMTHRFNALSGS